MSSRRLEDTQRRRWLQAALGTSLPAWTSGLQAAPPPDDNGRKVLRLLFRVAESTFDPAKVADVYSRSVNAHIFEGLYGHDPLCTEARMVPILADGLPEPADDFRRFTVRLKRGVYFADDPAFGGRPREVTMADIVFAVQRVVDPANLCPVAEDILQFGILGLAEVREAAVRDKKPFDYSRPIEGLAMPDPYTLVIRMREPRPRVMWFFADPSILGAQAIEVWRQYGDRIGEHPVGTGPFRLKSWRRSSRIVLERNPTYRDRRFEAQPLPGDAEGQAIVERLKGRRLPMVDEVDISVVEELQPQWLTFLNGGFDMLAGIHGHVPEAYVNVAAPGGRLAPNLARRGIRLFRKLNADRAYMFFNMDDPMVGGYTPAQVALRRAICLAYDVHAEIRQIRRGQGVPAQSPIPPHCLGYDPAFKSDMGDHDVARAKALLDVYGYLDRNGDGWREKPDGSPLELVMNTETRQIDREYNELWRKCMSEVGIRIRFEQRQWPENYKAAEAGKLQMWMLGGSAALPDGLDMIADAYSKNIGSGNFANFRLPAFDRLFERLQGMPDGPEREAVFNQAKRLMVAYMPYRALAHRFAVDLTHPWVSGYRRPVFAMDWWHNVDLDPAQRAATLKG